MYCYSLIAHTALFISLLSLLLFHNLVKKINFHNEGGRSHSVSVKETWLLSLSPAEGGVGLYLSVLLKWAWPVKTPRLHLNMHNVILYSTQKAECDDI